MIAPKWEEDISYFKKEAERQALNKGAIVNHVLQKNGTARLSVIGAEAAIEGCR